METDKKTRLGSAILVVHENKVLLGRRAKEPNFGKWVLPGGKIEFGETHEIAAKREAIEELGIEIEIERLAGKGLYYIINDHEHRVIIYSIAKPITLKIMPSSDISEAAFFSKDQLITLDISPVVKSVLFDEKWLERID